MEHLLAEPKTDHVSVDGMLNFGEDNVGKGMELDGFSCGYEYFLGMDDNEHHKLYGFIFLHEVYFPLLLVYYY